MRHMAGLGYSVMTKEDNEGSGCCAEILYVKVGVYCRYVVRLTLLLIRFHLCDNASLLACGLVQVEATRQPSTYVIE